MNRRGFTFIELVTVWAIICILAAILFPVFSKAREKGRQISCLSNLLNTGVALRMYAADYCGHLPLTDNDLAPVLNPRYLPEAAVLTCPTLRGDQLFDYPPLLPEQMVARRAGFDYVYRGGLADDDAPNQGLAADRFRDVHNDGANTLFLDGHAKWLTQEQFMTEAERQQLRGSDRPPRGQKVLPGLVELGKLQAQRTGSPYLTPLEPPRQAGDEE